MDHRFQLLHSITFKQREERACGGNELAQRTGGPCLKPDLSGQLDLPRGKLLLIVIGVFCSFSLFFHFAGA